MNSVIIVECKPEEKFHDHQPQEKFEPEKYAVDGVLHYARFLKSEFNVIAIAASGQNKNNLSISNFFIKNDGTETKLPDNKLLAIYDYLSLLENEKYVEKLKHENILVTAANLNDKLYNYSVPENERATIVSGILIALQSDGFRKSYVTDQEPSHLADDLLIHIKRILEKNNMGDKVPALMNQYNTIKNSSKLTTDKTVRNIETGLEETNTLLRDLIHDIDTKIFPLTKYKNAGYDILGEFYSEFIRYANGDRKLGLVLTPLHVRELFVELAELQKDDVIYDNCCGTAGFLINGMKRLMEFAGTDSKKIEDIQNKQILGIDERPDMFTYACSNMMMRGDGKSNISRGDSLSDTNKEKIKKFKPTVGFLNPPYSTKVPELEFIYNNLECLQPNGKCIAIVPINSIADDSGKNYDWKKKLLEKHTLLAAFSMPIEVFAPIGVVTAIVVFKAHNPQPDDHKTYFAYWREDGFEKKKKVGRVDSGKWESIRENWLENYKYRKEVRGQSLLRHVTAKDEWCAEAYMETDYSSITENDFVKVMRNYVIFKFKNEESVENEDEK
jgi:type I restriction-modification system DNA methylase subunit